MMNSRPYYMYSAFLIYRENTEINEHVSTDFQIIKKNAKYAHFPKYDKKKTKIYNFKLCI